LIVLHGFGTEKYVFQLGDWKTTAVELIYLLFWQQFNILRLFFKAKMMKALTMKAKIRKMTIHAFRTLQMLEECDPVVLVLVLTLVPVGRPSAEAHGSKKLVLLAFLLSICHLQNYEKKHGEMMM
jgi:hypothetical protein